MSTNLLNKGEKLTIVMRSGLLMGRWGAWQGQGGQSFPFPPLSARRDNHHKIKLHHRKY